MIDNRTTKNTITRKRGAEAPFYILIQMRTKLVQLQNFIQATRDSGYKNTASAIAELIDNAIESSATLIEVDFNKASDGSDGHEVSIVDDGRGMNENELGLALQFGGSSRFNSRRQMGRYGMGLPNSSLSQCKRIEVTTWRQRAFGLFNYLDVDEVVEQNQTSLPPVKKITRFPLPPKSRTGTHIVWKKCDRLSFKYLRSLQKHLHLEMGRIFRCALLRGVRIKINGVSVQPFDPLFIAKGTNLVGAAQYGKILKYDIKIPGDSNRTSAVSVKFVELPVEHWSQFTSEEKRKQQIVKRAGVSILRAEREIDYGWFFMGDKRKENYDDWWRCEISFNPELDEAFGVTHTKQEIRETEHLSNILIPDLEQIARVLNNRVRLKFISLKQSVPTTHSKQQTERTDIYLPAIQIGTSSKKVFADRPGMRGLDYQILVKSLETEAFYEVEERDHKVVLTINKNHIFYDKIFLPLQDQKITKTWEFKRILEILLFAIGRSELLPMTNGEFKTITKFKKELSSNIKAFIS